MKNKIVITESLLNAGKSINGSWSQEQLQWLGVPWPLASGWRRRLIGTEVTQANYEEFLGLKNKHIKRSKTRKVRHMLYDTIAHDNSESQIQMIDSPPINIAAIGQRVKLIMDRFGHGKADGSMIFTCEEQKCLYPSCLCGLK